LHFKNFKKGIDKVAFIIYALKKEKTKSLKEKDISNKGEAYGRKDLSI
jgi:hypothetical protein